MKEKMLIGSHAAFAEPNIYADKSSLVLEWLLLKGVDKDQFSIREIANETGVSLGQVQKVIGVLVRNGCLRSTGLRTAKKFVVYKPKIIMKDWLERYNISRKCKMWTFSAGFSGRQRLLELLNGSALRGKFTLALHSAADALGYKNNNLETLELYVPDKEVRQEIEKILYLEPRERGYDVLMIEPYYKNMLYVDKNDRNVFLYNTEPLLTYLDLYHYPLRGQEQAEFMAERILELKRIYK